MNALKIKEIRKKLKLTQEELAKAIGVSKRTIINYEKGETIPETKSEILHRLLNEDLKIHPGVQAQEDNNDECAPYLENVGASAGMNLLTHNGDHHTYIRVPGAGVDFYINVYGDSMYPKYCSGEIIGIKQVDIDMVFFGHAYVVEMIDGEAYIKYIFKGKDEEHYELRSENPAFQSREFHISKIKNVYKIKTTITKNSL